jgi:hypothetical protein
MNDKVDEILNKMIAGLDAVKQQDSGLGIHLRKVMRDQYFYYDKKTVLTDVGGKVDKAIFIESGHLIDSVFDERGDKQTIFLYSPKDIKAGPEFMRALPSNFYVEATAGTCGVFITFDQMAEVYKRFPATQELASLITAEFRIREMKHLVSLHRKGIDRVLEFYLAYPHLLPAGLVLTDADVSSFLLLSEGALRRLRRKLIRQEKLPDYSRKTRLRRAGKIMESAGEQGFGFD